MDLNEVKTRLAAIQEKYLVQVDIDDAQGIVLPSTIYHYTDGQGFRGIIESKELWLTHANYLNDVSEAKYGRRLAVEGIHSLAKRHHATISLDDPAMASPSSGKSNLDHVTSLPRSTTDLMIKSCFLSNAVKYVGGDQNHAQYVASFCLQDNLLSQWRAYGNRGGGYSLGFKLSSRIMQQEDINEFFCFPICYDVGRQKNLVNGFIDEVFRSLEDCIPHMNKQLAFKGIDPLLIMHLQTFFVGLMMLAVCFKDPGFSVEHEYRISIIYKLGHTENVSFREGSRFLIPFVKVNLQQGADPISLSTVLCGPGPDSDLAAASARMFLDKNGFSQVKVERSEIPLKV